MAIVVSHGEGYTDSATIRAVQKQVTLCYVEYSRVSRRAEFLESVQVAGKRRVDQDVSEGREVGG